MGVTRMNFPTFLGIDQSGEATEHNTSPSAENIDTSRGTLKRCAGYSEYISAQTPGSITTLMKFTKRNSGAYEQKLIAATQTGVYCWENGAWQTIADQRTAGDYSFINYQLNGNDVMYMTNGADFPLKWDADAAAESASIPKFSNITLHYERLWGAGVSGEPDRVYYSVAFSPEDFTTQNKSGFIDIPTFDGGSIVRVLDLMNDVVVFKSDNIYRIYGTYPDTYEVAPVYGIVGPIAPRSIVSTGTSAIFLSKEGLCVYDGVKAQPFSISRISGIISRISPEYASRAEGVYYRGVYYLALPIDGSQSNNAVLEYDVRRNCFMLRTGLCVTSFLEFDDKLLIADGGSKVWRFLQGDTYGGAKINAHWTTPDIDLNALDEVKSLRRIYLAGRGGEIKITAATESSERVKKLSLDPRLQTKSAAINGRGRRISFKFENVGGGEMELLPPTVIAETEGD